MDLFFVKCLTALSLSVNTKEEMKIVLRKLGIVVIKEFLREMYNVESCSMLCIFLHNH